MKGAAFVAIVAACGGPSADDVFGADTTLEYVTRTDSPQQGTCLQGGTFALSGSQLTLSKCEYGGVSLDAEAPLAATFELVDTPDDVSEDRSTVTGTLALSSSSSDIPDCDVALTITRTARYANGTLISALLSWTGTLCGQDVDVTTQPY